MKTKILIFSLFLVSLVLKSNDNQIDSIEITYIANCGFLIEMDSKKIIIDGLFTEGFNHYTTPDSATQILLTSGSNPFDNIDFVFVTHYHADHFNSNVLIECMLSNPACKLICPAQVAEELKKNPQAYKILKPRIIECTPDTFNSQKIEIGEIEIIACRLKHGHERHKNVQNIGYLITSNNKSVFHTGDADPNKVYKYTGANLADKNIDVALINDGFGHMKNAEITRRFLNANYNITMHLPMEIARIWMEPLKDKPELFSNPYVFTKLREKKVFYINTKQAV